MPKFESSLYCSGMTRPYPSSIGKAHKDIMRLPFFFQWKLQIADYNTLAGVFLVLLNNDI